MVPVFLLCDLLSSKLILTNSTAERGRQVCWYEILNTLPHVKLFTRLRFKKY